MPNFAALRAAVFKLSTKNLRRGRISAPPTVGARVNVSKKCCEIGSLKLTWRDDLKNRSLLARYIQN